MIIGEERAVDELWDAVRAADAAAARRPARPARLRARRAAASRATRACARATARRPRPCSCPRARRRTARRSGSTRCAATPTASAGARRSQIDEGRSWIWLEDGVDPLQGGGVGVDAVGRAAPAGVGRPGGAQPRLRAARDARSLPRCCSSACPTVCLFVRPGERAGDPRLRGDRHAAARSRTAR